jgi:propionyl-CoA synthetase
VFWAASDVGWVVGHSYIVYAPLLRGCTTVLYEGKPVGTPDAGAVLAGDRAARRASAVHRADRVPRHQAGGPEGELHGDIRLCASAALFLAGERSDPTTCAWAGGRSRCR